MLIGNEAKVTPYPLLLEAKVIKKLSPMLKSPSIQIVIVLAK